jgi:hypothetical protein
MKTGQGGKSRFSRFISRVKEQITAMGNAIDQFFIPDAYYGPKDVINHIPSAFWQRSQSADLHFIARCAQFCYNPISILRDRSILRDDATPGRLMLGGIIYG